MLSELTKMKKYLLLALITSTAWSADPSSVVVQGSCNIKVTPDLGTISFTAENQSKNQQEAVKKTNDQINLLKKQISDLKLAGLDLKNTNYSVYPVRDYEKERYIDRGTKVSLTLEVTTSDIARIGETLILATKNNIQNVGQLSTFLSPEKSQAEYLNCLDIAAVDAKNKAQQIGKKLGFRVGEVLHVNESPSIPQPQYRNALSMAFADSTGGAMEKTTIEAGQQQFATTLQVTFSIK